MVKTLRANLLTVTVAAILCLVGCSPHKQKPFPSRAITIICPPAPGGISDTLTRALAASAQQVFGVPVVVENKPRGANAVGLNYGAHASPDGYTVTYVVAELATLPHLGLSPISPADFDLLARTNYNPAAVTVRADAKWRTLRDLLRDAKANPNSIRVGNSGTGSIWHLAALALQEAAKVQFKHIPFNGAAPAVQALLGGHVDMVCVSTVEVQPHVEAKKLRILAVLTTQREPMFPNVPFARKLGYDVDIGAWGGLALPKNVPKQIRQMLLEGFRKAFKDPKFVDLMKERGVRLAWLEGDAFRRFVEFQSARNRDLITKLGMNLTRGDVGHLYFPKCLAALLMLLLMALLLSLKWHPTEDLPPLRVKESLKMAGLVLSFVAILPFAGFIASSMFFLLASVLLSGKAKIWQASIYAIAAGASVWLLFAHILGVPLP
jgi:tripartite-type tricarboxylate transporter receptor subunit TctC